MKRNSHKSGSPQIALSAVVVVLILGALVLSFIQDVQKQLWEQSVQTILESTQQGCNTLQIQLRDDFESLGVMSKDLKKFTAGQKEELEAFLSSYGQLEEETSLYLPDGTSIPEASPMDERVREALAGNEDQNGMIDPHISSATGVNVFNLFVKATMQDGTSGFLVKEYEVGDIVDTFTLSFYQDAGFSYVINQTGDVLIRSPHPKSNKTVQNLFDMLPESQNDPASLNQFAQSLGESDTGWAVFNYQGEQTVFCYTPLKLQSDWLLISIIPQDVVNAQTNEILMRSFVLIGCIILGIAILAAFYLRHAWQTNKKLRNQAVYIEHLYNAVPEGIALISVEVPHRILQLNQEGLRLLDYPKGTSDQSPGGLELREVIHPDDYGEIEALFQDTVENGHKNVFEFRFQQASGSFFWADGIVEKTLDQNGNPILISAIHDVTEEKLAEEAAEREKLQERLTLVGAISNAYPVIIRLNFTQDLLHFVYVKPGLKMKLGGQQSYEELFQDMLPTVHPDSLEEFRRRLAPDSVRNDLGQKKEEIFLEAKQRFSDGEYHWVSTQIISVDNPYSKDRLAILISRPIDEQRHEEEQRREALQSALDNAKAASVAKSQFLSNMSHDIRTPMNAIVGMTAIATAHLEERDRVLECLKKIHLSSNHLLSLINDVLDMSKIESGKLSIREEPFNFAELLADSVELVRPQAEANQIQMDVHLERLKNEAVIGDPLRVRQVCINIFSNAVKYTQPGGWVRIEASQEESARRGYQRYLFRCVDTGVGMSKEFLEKLFQPFERARDSTSGKVAGTGLGMAITKNVVDLMNGQILVESKPGEGSAFTVILPLKLQDSPPDEEIEEWKDVRSLIVDDDLQTCENAGELLEEMGLRAQFVTEGAKAVEYVIREKDTADPFRLVIVDWKMPGMNGVEVARKIRAEVGPDLPVIVLTAYDWSEIESEARKAGVTAFLSKPFYRSKVSYLLRELSGEREPEELPSLDPAPDYAGRRVLLVEDNEMNREIARTLIEEMGIQVEEACDGEEAVRRVDRSAEGYYDIILMDIQMPKLNGYEATKKIRRLKRRDAETVPIIAMTADAFEEDVQNAIHAGMTAHFAKPIEVDLLEQILRKYMKGDSAGGSD